MISLVLVRMQKPLDAAILQCCAMALLPCYFAAQQRCCSAVLLCRLVVGKPCIGAKKINTLRFHIVTAGPNSTKLRFCFKNGLSNLPRDIFRRATFCRSTMWSPDAPYVFGGVAKKYKVIYFQFLVRKICVDHTVFKTAILGALSAAYASAAAT